MGAMGVPRENTGFLEAAGWFRGLSNSNPKKPLNRHDAKVAKGAMFRTLDRRTRKPVYGAFRSSVPLPPLSHFGLGVLGALAVENFGLGLIKSQALSGCEK